MSDEPVAALPSLPYASPGATSKQPNERLNRALLISGRIHFAGGGYALIHDNIALEACGEQHRDSTDQSMGDARRGNAARQSVGHILIERG